MPLQYVLVFLKEFFEKVNFEKSQQTTKIHEKLPSMQRVNDKRQSDIYCLQPKQYEPQKSYPYLAIMFFL